ncbi:MAG: TPM domain-containing protein [Gammaproteobacteria bacterium]
MTLRGVLAVAAGLLASASFAADAPRQPDGLLAVPPLARITDDANVLSPPDERALKDKLAAFETAHGSQIAILIVRSVKPEPIEDFANRVGNTWKIGRAEVGDGLLMVIAVQDKRVRIEVFRALEGAIPDATAKRIIREQIAPRFKTNDYAGGLNAALDAIFKEIEGGGLPAIEPRAPTNYVPEGDTIGLLLPFVIGGIVIGSILRKMFGVPGAMLAGGGAGVASYSVLSSALLGGIAGLFVFLVAAATGSSGGRAVAGRRRGGDIFMPGGWSGGGGGGWSGGGSGGWSSGGGGDAAGGGASGDW